MEPIKGSMLFSSISVSTFFIFHICTFVYTFVHMQF